MTGTAKFWEDTPAGVSLAVKAQPGAKRVAIGPVLEAVPVPGWPPARLKIAVAVPPEEGKANAAIIKALAGWLGVKSSAITLVAGQTSREKRFLIMAPVRIPAI
ncbi:DUF167 domain-containing protein [Acidocella sp.]|uniref:DUF167 domain-containing protein n=1 Tax=Acidocella sp. TaxID=50710 RepID=UPI003D00A9C2